MTHASRAISSPATHSTNVTNTGPTQTRDLYIGLMSGTSMDGIDAVLVDLGTSRITVIDQLAHPMPAAIRQTLQQLCHPGADEIQKMGQCDRQLGEVFGAAVLELLKRNNLTAQDIKAIGGHGQTIRHSPNSQTTFTLQIGDPNTIAHMTGITTIADFRRRDIAAGGEGAPLVPAFHKAMFSHPKEQRFVINIGGIGNITQLKPGMPTRGYDTGPGNALLDEWIQHCQQQAFDKNGDWGTTGKVHQGLKKQLATDPYFQRPAPKSTGREYFNLAWVNQHLAILSETINPEDIQATLADLTAWSIAKEIKQLAANDAFSAFVCGGGCHNALIMQMLANYLAPASLATTSVIGIDPDWVEAIAFAWLAKQTLAGLPGNEPAVTGARKPVILGGIYLA